MALAILSTEIIESGETAANETASFLTTTIRNILKKHESEVEYNNKLKQISLDEVRHHDCWNDCWVIIYDRVYDITQFLHQHPGGDSVLLENAGRDCTSAFLGHSTDAVLSMKQFEIGILPPHERIYRHPGKIRISESRPE